MTVYTQILFVAQSGRYCDLHGAEHDTHTLWTWLNLREHLTSTGNPCFFSVEYSGVPVGFSLNQSIDSGNGFSLRTGKSPLV